MNLPFAVTETSNVRPLAFTAVTWSSVGRRVPGGSPPEIRNSPLTEVVYLGPFALTERNTPAATTTRTMSVTSNQRRMHQLSREISSYARRAVRHGPSLEDVQNSSSDLSLEMILVLAKLRLDRRREAPRRSLNLILLFEKSRIRSQ